MPLSWNGVLSEMINLIDWKVPFLHHFSAASSVCGVAEGAESSQLLQQAWRMLPLQLTLSASRECSRRKTEKRWGRGGRKNDNTEFTRTYPDNRRCLHVSRRAPLRQGGAPDWVITEEEQTQKIKSIPKTAGCQAVRAKKDSNGLCETTECLIPATYQGWISEGITPPNILNLFTTFTFLSC